MPATTSRRWTWAAVAATVSAAVLGVVFVRRLLRRRETSGVVNDDDIQFATATAAPPQAAKPGTASHEEIVARTIAQLEAKTAAHPGDAALRRDLGELILDERGDGAAAEPHLRVAVAAVPEDATALFLLGRAAARQGRVAEATELVRQAIRLDEAGGASQWHEVLGILQTEAGDFAAAKVSYEEALAVDPANVAARNNLGKLLSNHFGNHDAARVAYETALVYGKGDNKEMGRVHANLGALLGSVYEDVAGAAEHCKAAIRFDPTIPTRHFNYACLAASLMDGETAIRHMEEAVALDGGASPRYGRMLEQMRHDFAPGGPAERMRAKKAATLRGAASAVPAKAA